jgi:hypothetical protein
VFSLREARALVYLDRLRGLNPWDRLTPPYDPDPDDGAPDDSGAPADADDGHEARPAGNQDPAGDRDDDAGFPGDSDGGDIGGHADDRDGDDGRFPDGGYVDGGYDDENGDEDEDDDGDDDGGPGSGPSGTPGRPGSPAGKAPLPALTTITISAGTLIGWSDAPAEVAGFGLVDPDSARDLIATASRHPRSRWCITLIGKDGEAIAHRMRTRTAPVGPGKPPGRHRPRRAG